APNVLTASSLTYTTTVEHWVFTAGPRGSSIWQNGVKVASQATAITRNTNVNSGSVFALGRGTEVSTTEEQQEFNFFQVNDQQWSDDLCQWWSAEPYAHLYKPIAQRRYLMMGDIAFRLSAGQQALMYAQSAIARSGATRAASQPQGVCHGWRYPACDGATRFTDEAPR